MSDSHDLVCKFDGARSPFSVQGRWAVDRLRTLVHAWPLLRPVVEHPGYGDAFELRAGDGGRLLDDGSFSTFATWMHQHEGHHFVMTTYGREEDFETGERLLDVEAALEENRNLTRVWQQVIADLGPEVTRRVREAMARGGSDD